jgi:hypothetical protein
MSNGLLVDLSYIPRLQPHGHIVLQDDVNVITVDWAGGSMSWKYWRAVANTRQVAREIDR